MKKAIEPDPQPIIRWEKLVELVEDYRIKRGISRRAIGREIGINHMIAIRLLTHSRMVDADNFFRIVMWARIDLKKIVIGWPRRPYKKRAGKKK